MSIGVKVAVVGPPVVDSMVAHVRVVVSRQSGSSFVDLASDREAGEQVFELGPDDKLEVLPRGLTATAVAVAEPKLPFQAAASEAAGPSEAGPTSARRAAVAAAVAKKEG